MTTLTPAAARDLLVHALTRYDRKQESKRGYNHYALAHYFAGVDRAMKLHAKGATLRAALVASFCDRVLDCCLKAVGEPPATREELR